MVLERRHRPSDCDDAGPRADGDPRADRPVIGYEYRADPVDQSARLSCSRRVVHSSDRVDHAHEVGHSLVCGVRIVLPVNIPGQVPTPQKRSP
jgi:hypothetical protein